MQSYVPHCTFFSVYSRHITFPFMTWSINIITTISIILIFATLFMFCTSLSMKMVWDVWPANGFPFGPSYRYNRYHLRRSRKIWLTSNFESKKSDTNTVQTVIEKVQGSPHAKSRSQRLWKMNLFLKWLLKLKRQGEEDPIGVDGVTFELDVPRWNLSFI